MRVAVGSQPTVSQGLPTCACEGWGRRTLRKKLSWFNGEEGGHSSALWSAESKMRHIGHLGHLLHPSPSPYVSTFVLPLDTDGLGRESEVDGAQLFLTLNKVIAQVISHPFSFLFFHILLSIKVLWRQASDESDRCGCTGSRSHEPAHRRPRPLGRSSPTGAAVESGSRLSD